MSFEIPASQKDTSLPMMLTLRGDEELVDDFTYDAEQAMDYLGIKRSRLTQISGKELRVARIRRDRYLRPVYREADLRDYSEWTRATASHQSSSRAIEQAIASLDDRFNDVFVVFNEKIQQFQDFSAELWQQKLIRLQSDLRQMNQLNKSELQAEQNELSHRLADLRSQLLFQQKQSEQQCLGLNSAVEKHKNLTELFHQDLREVLVVVKSLSRELLEQKEQSRALEERLVQSQQEQLAFSRALQVSLENLEENYQQLSLRQKEESLPVAPAQPGKAILLRKIPKMGMRKNHLLARNAGLEASEEQG